MAPDDAADLQARLARLQRAEPPPFRRCQVVEVEDRTPRLRRLVLAGDALDGLVIDEPAASVRLLVPGADGLAWPTWTGNQFELADGRRAPIRTFTPSVWDPGARRLTIDVVIAHPGVASDWAAGVDVGGATAEVAVSGPGRGDPIDPSADGYLLAGDEAALPAIEQLLAHLPSDMAATVHIEIGDASAEVPLAVGEQVRVHWHVTDPDDPPGTAFANAVEACAELPDGVWVAGEAAAVQRVRKQLFDVRGRDRGSVTVRGYWKHGRAATA